jgi:hypothetical protein
VLRCPRPGAEPVPGFERARRVTQFFLSLTDAIGESGTFDLFAAMCAVSFVFIWFKQPENRGRSLAEIQEMWERKAGRAGKEA